MISSPRYRLAAPAPAQFRLTCGSLVWMILLASVSGCATGGTARATVSGTATGSPSFSTQQLVQLWDREHVSPALPPLMTHAEVVSRLRALVEADPDLFHLEEVGRSVEDRSINHLWFGGGPFHVLLWSQMHGDETTATAALFDLYEFVRRHRTDPVVERLLQALTVHTVPMLNPDGAERFQRRNAQGIDINRDALLLQTPEGRALKTLRDRLEPAVGFNLHNQNWQTSAGRTGVPASISLLSVAYDEARSENEGRRLTKQLSAIIREALEPLAHGRMARYDDEFEVRAFGDNLTRWGTSVVLIETGAWPAEPPDPPLVRVNFVALVSALDALATGRVRRADPSLYDSLPINDSGLFYTLIKQATVDIGTGVPPFTADIGIVASRVVQQVDGRREASLRGRIDDLGDLRVFGALTVIDAAGLTVTPIWDPGLGVGDQVRLPDWSAHPAEHPLAVGEIADLLVLRPTATAGTYVVERVVRIR